MTIPVVIRVLVSCDDVAQIAAGQSSGNSSGVLSGGGVVAALEKLKGGDPVARAPHFDPWRVNAAFPDRWSAYVRAHFRSISQVIAAFDVSERTARKWWAGESGANGGHVAVACLTHPDTAPAMLFVAE